MLRSRKRKVPNSSAAVRRNIRIKRSSVEDDDPASTFSIPTEEQDLNLQKERSSLMSAPVESDRFDFEGIQYSPYFLNASDNPGMALVTEILDGSNYSTWKIAMTISLEAKNKLCFVDGSLPKPDDSHPHAKIWCRCNSMVKSWILNSVNRQIYGSILRFQNASDTWKDLMIRFQVTNVPRAYQLSQQVWAFQQGNLNLASYYTRLKTLWDDLESTNCVETCKNCTCCKAISEKNENAKVVKFLLGLNESYDSVKSQIIMKKHLPDLSAVYNLVDQDHNQRNIQNVAPSAVFHITGAQNSQSSTLSFSMKNK